MTTFVLVPLFRKENPLAFSWKSAFFKWTNKKCPHPSSSLSYFLFGIIPESPRGEWGGGRYHQFGKQWSNLSCIELKVILVTQSNSMVLSGRHNCSANLLVLQKFTKIRRPHSLLILPLLFRLAHLLHLYKKQESSTAHLDIVIAPSYIFSKSNFPAFWLLILNFSPFEKCSSFPSPFDQ